MIKQVGIEELFLSPRRQDRRIPAVSTALIDLVREFGPVEPIIVRKSGPQRYEILLNPETWLAAQQTGHHTVPILVRRNASEAEVDALLDYQAPESCISIARRYAAILDGKAQGRAHGAITDLAAEEGCSRSHVAHLLRILTLPELIQRAIDERLLNLGQAKALLRISSVEVQMGIATAAITGRWSVRRTEVAVREAVSGIATVEQSTEPDPQVVRLQRRLSNQLGSPVTVDTGAGHLIIDYRKDLDVLEGVLQRLGYRASES